MAIDLRSDTRGASIPLTHALSLGITALLIAGLLLGSGQLLDRQEERVTQKGLADIGEGITNEIDRVDRLAGTGPETNVTTRVTYPSRISGEGYDIALLDRANGGVVYTNASTQSHRVDIALGHDVCSRSINGGPVEIVYDSTDDCITLEPTSR